MISISRAEDQEDFEVAERFCRALAEWDAIEVQAYGVAPEVVLGIFHGETTEGLRQKFTADDACMLIARWDGHPAGCIAFSPFDETAVEIHKFYVDPEFRGRKIGQALMRALLAEIEKGKSGKIVLQTTIYMSHAISLYEAFDFRRCEQFRPIPDEIRHTEVFMSRLL
ncbi:GNAT family N-acetyltransferase [Rhizobium sp. BK251]|uniref:GNAT family N-acetyltransferase n=1 Tax=Rhizobium sp. BK251 TaxID=2512125 RepID=UPI001050F357|nr:GNAT family N-acetyltransferase [Rhizobium sp. BK251]TCL69826.1 acetyltransferase (GNAT) family protein [Rhizobium sp. BK251]